MYILDNKKPLLSISYILKIKFGYFEHKDIQTMKSLILAQDER